jgi:predicted dinucleotide-utilizing enzyme
MARTTYSGEVWTDAHGFAAVLFPSDADVAMEVEVAALAEGVTAELVAEPARRRFTVTTSEPHVKVAWRAKRAGNERSG